MTIFSNFDFDADRMEIRKCYGRTTDGQTDRDKYTCVSKKNESWNHSFKGVLPTTVTAVSNGPGRVAKYM